MKIRAAVLEEFGKPLVVQDLELDPPKEGEVLVQLKACGVCHTDMYTASGVDPSGYAPCVLGHEGAGVVAEVGPGVTSLQQGDHVVTLFSPECRECVNCKSGKTNICLKIRAQQGQGYLPDGTTRLSRGDERIRHFMGCSTFAEATVMPEVALAKVDKSASFDAICLLACGATTGIAAALWKAEVEQGSSVAVFGAGMVGLGAVAGAKLRGAETIVAVDMSEQRLELAKQFGATHTILASSGDPVEQIVDMTDGFGADYTFEATGNVAVMGQAVEAARMGWGLCTVLGVAGRGEKLEIIPRFLITGRKVQGGSFGGAKGRTHVPQLVDMYVRGELELDGFVSHRISLDEVNKGFDLMHHQDGIRSVIQFS
ncbi:MAG TPA: S-(hydroxymethyl)glutathione dehydrogenase [Planctomycetes bacterium]|nr:S-(hydroxymethyl)glutathione dehydrogenase [Planctomycetota bacterium]